ncbi:hypothetical protein QTP88_011906 [Uroleucon formosanum]
MKSETYKNANGIHVTAKVESEIQAPFELRSTLCSDAHRSLAVFKDEWYVSVPGVVVESSGEVNETACGWETSNNNMLLLSSPSSSFCKPVSTLQGGR